MFRILLTLSSCSANHFIYNRVDILLRWYLDDYVSLDRAQQARFDGRLRRCSNGTVARSYQLMWSCSMMP